MNAVLGIVTIMWVLLANQASAFTLQNPAFATTTRSTRQVDSFSAMQMSASNDTIGTEIRMLKKKMPVYEPNGPVFAVHSIEDFLDSVENTEENELVIVKFHAKWCKVCARAAIKYRKMANKYASPTIDTPVPIKFISVEATANPKIIEQVGIKLFPYIQIYRNRECVASFRTGPAHNFQRMVGDTVEQKLNTEVSEWNAFSSEFKNEISSGLESLELLRLQAVIEEECEINTENCVTP